MTSISGTSNNTAAPAQPVSARPLATMHALQDDPLRMIFSYLTNPSDLKNAALTCKRFDSIITGKLFGTVLHPDQNTTLSLTDSLWKELYLQRFPAPLMLMPDQTFQQAYKYEHILISNLTKGVYVSRPLQGHKDAVMCLTVHNGKIISGSADNTIRIWDLTTGILEHTLKGHTSSVRCLTVHGGKIISGSLDNTIRIWDLTTGNLEHTLQGHTNSVHCLTVHGGKIISGSSDNTIGIWDLTTGNPEHTLQGHTNSVYCLAIYGGKIISGSLDNTIRIWDLKTGNLEQTLKGHTDPVVCLTIYGGKIISGSSDDTIRIWDLTTGNLEHTLTGHTNWVYCLTVHGGKIISGSYDNTIRIWDLTTGNLEHTLQGHTGTVSCLAIHGGKIISGSRDDTIWIWDFTASDRQVYQEIADQLKSTNVETLAIAMQRFSRMPKKSRNLIYQELFTLLNPPHHYIGYGEHAFQDQNGLKPPSAKKAQAIENYLLNIK